MIIKKLQDVLGTTSEIHDPGKAWTSRRLLLAKEKMGFSLHDTLIYAGSEIEMHYENHLEAVYCIAGKGSIEEKQNGTRHPIEAGTVYALDRHDHHILRAETQMRMVCVFNPPLTGYEVHDKNGAYPLLQSQD